MSPYTCPICTKLLKSSSSQVIHMHEKSNFHQAALKQKPDGKQPVETVQKTVKAPIPSISESTPSVISIQTTKPVGAKPNGPTKKEFEQYKKEQKDDKEEWDGEFF